MTLRRKLRRKLRTLVRQHGNRPREKLQRRKSGAAQELTPRQKRRTVQAIVCGSAFTLLIALKLLLPGNLASFRAELSHWLVRDADFAAAFSAVGRAVGGTQELASSLGEAYTAVFGYEAATEVFGERLEEEREIIEFVQELPPRAVSEKRELGFACSSPLQGEVTSPFGWREDPNGGAEAFHYGIDIAAPAGTDIACFADGTVGVVGESTVWGNYLTVQHEGDFATLYAHCERIDVSSGQEILLGQTVAAVGQSGNATGPHLHFELRDGAEYLDPLHYVGD